MHRRVISLIVPAVLAACPAWLRAQIDPQAGERAAATAQVAGCYHLVIDAWEGARAPHNLGPARRPPEHVALDTVRVAGPYADRYAVWPAALDSSALTSRMPTPASWAAVGVDSITVLWSTGFVGVELRMQVRGDRLTGIARAFHDGLMEGKPPDPVAPIAARRVPCPSWLRIPAG